MDYLIGTSGWHYDHWRDRFYPERLAKAKWLDYYARFFSTVELNASFYRLPTEKAFERWRDTSPPGFVFAIKASRLITHYRRLANVEEALATFFSRARLLGAKLGPILYQLPPGLHRDDARLDDFLALLPRDLHHVLEFRHASWFADSVFDILRRHNAAFCVLSMPDFDCPVLATADFAYVRFHGSQAKYSSLYTDVELDGWAERIRSLSANGPVYAYFNNDANAYAVHNALALMQLLGVIARIPQVPAEQALD